MRKILTYILSLFATIVMAQTTTDYTTDYIEATVENAIMPGGEEGEVVLISLHGTEHDYTGFQIDLTLPEGMEAELNTESENPNALLIAMCEEGADGLYPYTYNKMTKKYTYTHMVDGTYGAAGERVVRVSCFSTRNENFTKREGNLFMIILKAGSYVKPGMANILVSNTKFITYDNETITTTGYTVTQGNINGVEIGSNAKASLNVSAANKWSTCIMPFAVTPVPDGLKVYSCNSKDDNEMVMNLKEESAIEPYTPYILYSEDGFSADLNGTVDASLYPENGKMEKGYLTGAIEAQTTNTGYILQKNGGVVKFYKANPEKEYSIPAGKCWATPNDALLQSYSFKIMDITGVKSIKDAYATKHNIYTTDGKIINAPLRGHTYIIK